MSRVNVDPKLSGESLTRLVQATYRELSEHAKQINGISEGRVSKITNAQTAAPTTGEYQVGDFVRNSSPSELGSAGSKYVIYGWICTTAPNTFKQCRFLTGN